MGSVFFQFIVILVLLLVIILAFVFCREIICWYFKTNKILVNQEKIIGLLLQIANKTGIENPAANVNYVTLMGELVRITQRNGAILSGKLTLSEQPEKYVTLLSGGSIKKIDLNTIISIEPI